MPHHLHAQNAHHFRVIDSLLEIGNIQDAHKYMTSHPDIFNKKDNSTESVLSSSYKLYLQNYAQEDKFALINNLKDDWEKSSQPFEKTLKAYLLAKVLYTHLDHNSYLILQRPAHIQSDDIKIWGAQNYIDTIVSLYRQVFQQKELLLNTPVERLNVMLSDYSNFKEYYTTAYDFLALEYIDFVENAGHYNIDIKATHPTITLASEVIETLLDFYSKNNKDNSIVYWKMTQLQLEQNIHPNTEKLNASYLALAQQYAHSPAHLWPFLIYIQSQTDNKSMDIKVPGEDYSLQSKRDISDYLLKVIRAHPNSKYAALAIPQYIQLNNKSISVQVPEVVLPHQNVPILVSYKNIPEVKINIYKVDYEAFYGSTLAVDEYLKKTPLIASYRHALLNSSDLESHSTEIPLLPENINLEVGQYVLQVDNNGEKIDNQQNYVFFQVSNVAFIKDFKRNDNYNGLIFLHRQSGQLINVDKVEIKEIKSQYKNDRYINQYLPLKNVTVNTHKTNLTEVFKDDKNYSTKLFILHHGQDKLYFTDYVYAQNSPNVAPAIRKDLMFTDRGLYRPGQKVSVKIISYESASDNRNDFKVVPSEPLTVELFDANRKKIDSVKVITNQWGSATVEFSLPTHLLNGSFSIKTESGSINFRVEEYKRPTYRLDVVTPKESYKIGDKVDLKVNALAYAGYGIDNAQVTYKIYRHITYPYIWRCYWMPRLMDRTLISSGETLSQSNGEILIPIEMLADPQVDKSMHPIYSYEVEVNVTDINGEVKSLTHNLNAGYTSEFIHINVDDVVLDNPSTLKVVTHNINSVPLDKDVKVKIYKLKSSPVKRKRLWSMPTDKSLDKETFESLFPYDEYENESSIFDREKESLVFETTKSSIEAQWDMNTISWPSNGYYLVEAQILGSDEIVDKQYFHVNKTKLKGDSEKEIIIAVPQKTWQPSDNLNIQILTPFSKTYVMSLISSFKGVQNYEDVQNINYKITEADRGGIFYSGVYVYNNRVYNQNLYFDVPMSNKQLELKWLSHQDKLLPGQSETWSVEVIGDKPENVELLATMYDASLDAIAPAGMHQHLGVYTMYYLGEPFIQSLFSTSTLYVHPSLSEKFSNDYRENRPHLKNPLFGNGLYYDNLYATGYGVPGGAPHPTLYRKNNMVAESSAPITNKAMDVSNDNIDIEENVLLESKTNSSQENTQNNTIQARSNFNETAFFIPMIYNKKGNFTFDFTLPESVTQWKFQALAHTPDMKLGYLKGQVISQKDIMIQPNVPRFVRLNDQVVLSAKVANVSEQTINAKAFIELYNPQNNQIISSSWLQSDNEQNLQVAPQSSAAVSWTIKVPASYNGVLGLRYFADATHIQDAVSYVIPVLSDREVVTEAYPFYINGSGQRSINISTTSPSLTPKRLVVEYSANPMWYVIQTMPYIMDINAETADGVAQKLLVTSLAYKIAQENPELITKLKNRLNADNNKEKNIESRLEQNQELKNILLQETPWVLESESMSYQLSKLIETFDMNTLAMQKTQLSRELFKRQNSDGGWAWMDGMKTSECITMSILQQLTKMREWGIDDVNGDSYQNSINRAIAYMDMTMTKMFAEYWKHNKKSPYVSPMLIQLINMRYEWVSQVKLSDPIKAEIKSYINHIKDEARKSHHYQKAQLAVIASHINMNAWGEQLMESVIQSAITKDEMGMYWPTHQNAYYWYYNAFEAHYWVIKALNVLNYKTDNVPQLKKWILKQKQTQHWDNLRNTVYALDALVLSDQNWYMAEPEVTMTYNGQGLAVDTLSSFKDWNYIKMTVDSGTQIPAQKQVDVAISQSNPNMPTWGAVYWQYDENIDKISTNNSSPFKLTKRYFISDKTASNDSWVEIKGAQELAVGDIVKVILTIEIDRDLEFVHIKDYKPVGFEPKESISGYRYNQGLGYYMNIKDVCTEFFMDYIQKGQYTFSYEYKVELKGQFNSGHAEIQSYYAPEFRNIAPSIPLRVK